MAGEAAKKGGGGLWSNPWVKWPVIILAILYIGLPAFQLATETAVYWACDSTGIERLCEKRNQIRARVAREREMTSLRGDPNEMLPGPGLRRVDPAPGAQTPRSANAPWGPKSKTSIACEGKARGFPFDCGSASPTGLCICP